MTAFKAFVHDQNLKYKHAIDVLSIGERIEDAKSKSNNDNLTTGRYIGYNNFSINLFIHVTRRS